MVAASVKPLDDVVQVRKRPEGGVELIAVADGLPLLVLDPLAALTLADELTMAAERPLRAVA